MIRIGHYNTLTILRETSVGLYLGDKESEEDVLLPNKYCPEVFNIEDDIEVFVYLDYAERKVATNLTPKIFMNEFALLQVQEVNNIGAFMNWGLEKGLLVPYREQRENMVEGRWYVVYMDLDTDSDRLYASNKIEKRLINDDLTVEENQEIDLLVYKKTDLGYSVIVNNIHKGLVFESDVLKELNIGDKLKGFVKKIREENKLDISIQPIGYDNFNDPNAQLIYKMLTDNEGFLLFNDKSTPEDITEKFGISKKAFKKAIGSLYKDRKITIEAEGIKMI